MEIHIKTIPHKDQAYDTVGNYFEEKGITHFEISKLPSEDWELLVLIHELIEQHLCKKRKIKEKDITAFDLAFEALRKSHKKLIGNQEPGHMVSAPYHKEHVFAETIEKLLAQELKVDWDKYDKYVSSL
ncbi:unnamed protein product [Sphagnum balticum]